MRNISKSFSLIGVINCANIFANSDNEIQSLFMAEDKSKQILQIINSDNNKNSTEPEVELVLNGILFINDEDWTVWINDKAYSSIGQQKGFSIDCVELDCVEITLNNGQTLKLTA